MNKYKTLWLGIFVIYFLTLVGCSSSDDESGIGFSGPTTAAEITEDNAENIGISAAEGTVQAITGRDADSKLPFSGNNRNTYNIVSPVAYSTHDNTPFGVTITSDDINANLPSDSQIFCGGSVSVPDDFNANNTNGTIVYNNFCMDFGSYGEVIIDGSVTYSSSSSQITTSYDVTVTRDGQTERLTQTITCSTDTNNSDCTTVNDFTDSSGTVNRMDEPTITGNDTNGYQVNATFRHGEFGTLEITTLENVMLGCDNGMPNDGTIKAASDNNTEITISFENDCSGYTGTYIDADGEEGTFEGDWS